MSRRACHPGTLDQDLGCRVYFKEIKCPRLQTDDEASAAVLVFTSCVSGGVGEWGSERTKYYFFR